MTLAATLLLAAAAVSAAPAPPHQGKGWTAAARNLGTRQVEVILDGIPYPTDKYVRIGYTLKMWEFEKEGLKLQRISILDAVYEGGPTANESYFNYGEPLYAVADGTVVAVEFVRACGATITAWPAFRLARRWVGGSQGGTARNLWRA